MGTCMYYFSAGREPLQLKEGKSNGSGCPSPTCLLSGVREAGVVAPSLGDGRRFWQRRRFLEDEIK